MLRSLLHGEHVRFAGEFFTVDTRINLTALASSRRCQRSAHDIADGLGPHRGHPEVIAGHKPRPQVCVGSSRTQETNKSSCGGAPGTRS
jgi:hypothetical protein